VQNKTYVIGITGGVGSGKSLALNYLKETYPCVIYIADQIANDIKEPGSKINEELVKLLGPEILYEDGNVNKPVMAAKMFASKELTKKVNEIIHPAVKDYLTGAIKEAKKDENIKYIFIEAALLIEAGYKDILDEIWYVRRPFSERCKSLFETRGYSEEKIESIMNKQLSDGDFTRESDRIIENNGSIDELYEAVDKCIKELD
jgi:dephospho-CoA kinase